MLSLLLLVAVSSVLVTARPGEVETETLETGQDLNKNGDNKFQLSDLILDVQYTRHPLSEAFASAGGSKKSSGYGRRRRGTAEEQDTNEVEHRDEEEAGQESNGQRYFGDTARLLAIAGAKPQVVDLSGSYSGRKKRSPQIQHSDDDQEQVATVPEQVSENEGQRYFGNTARLLAIAGAKPQVVDLSGSYSGRKKRSPQIQHSDDVQEQVAPLPEQVSENEGRRYFGNTARLLAIAGAKPQVVDLSGSYSGRKKRSPQIQHSDDVQEQVAPVPEQVSENEGRRYFGNTARLLAIAGAKPQVVDLSGSYSGRKKRSAELPLSEVSIHAVKIKSRGKYGNVAHEAPTGATSSRAIFDVTPEGRKKRSNFIPFSEYDQRRVKTLKIEQNDFLALPARLRQETKETERQKRKFHHTEIAVGF